jgi:hypothetical protein
LLSAELVVLSFHSEFNEGCKLLITEVYFWALGAKRGYLEIRKFSGLFSFGAVVQWSTATAFYLFSVLPQMQVQPLPVPPISLGTDKMCHSETKY